MRRLSDVLRTMNFEETEEQNMIRNMVRDFAEEILLPTTLARDQEQRAPLEEWKKFCETSLQELLLKRNMVEVQ